MLYSCTHMTTVGVKGLNTAISVTIGTYYLRFSFVSNQLVMLLL